MKSVGAYDAKTHLPRLLKEVAQGEQYTITKHGVPVAMLLPVHGKAGRDVHEVVQDIITFRRGRVLGELSIREMIDEGRRR
jgi:prevent-host-death family protein